MVALDTSSLLAFLNGDSGDDVDAIRAALSNRYAVIPPVVVCECLNFRGLTQEAKATIRQLPRLEATSNYWDRAADTRLKILRNGLKARLADTLIAQSCLDYGVELITRDVDFRHFQRLSGLKLWRAK